VSFLCTSLPAQDTSSQSRSEDNTTAKAPSTPAAQAALSPERIISILQQQPELLAAAKEAAANQLSVDPETITDDMVYDQIRQDPNLRAQITEELRRRGYDVNSEMEVGSTATGRGAALKTGSQQGTAGTRYSEDAGTLGIADRITWAGMLSGTVKWGAYRAAEVFVLPSHSENFGIVVAEALACGLPVLISDKVNIWCEIAASQAGIVASDTLDGTRELFTRWIGMSTEQQKRMGQQAKACFETCFEVNQTASGFADLLGRIVGRTIVGEASRGLTNRSEV